MCVYIEKSVKCTFTGVKHRLCTWHLAQNLLKGRNAKVLASFEKLRTVVKNESDFEDVWAQACGGATNNLLQLIYSNRHKWAHFACHSDLDLGMSTSQRSESFNALVKRYFAKGTTLAQIVKVSAHEFTYRVLCVCLTTTK